MAQEPSTPARRWPDLSAYRAGLWMTKDSFVLLFAQAEERDAALGRLQEQAQLRGGYPAKLEVFQHGVWPGLRMERELQATPLAISGAFPASDKIEVEDYAPVALMAPGRTMLPMPFVRALYNKTMEVVALVPRPGQEPREVSIMAREGDPSPAVRPTLVGMHPSDLTVHGRRQSWAFVPQRNLSLLGQATFPPASERALLACETSSLPLLRTSEVDLSGHSLPEAPWSVVEQADQFAHEVYRMRELHDQLDGMKSLTDGWLGTDEAAVKRRQAHLDALNALIPERQAMIERWKSQGHVFELPSSRKPSVLQDDRSRWIYDTDQAIVVGLHRAIFSGIARDLELSSSEEIADALHRNMSMTDIEARLDDLPLSEAVRQSDVFARLKRVLSGMHAPIEPTNNPEVKSDGQPSPVPGALSATDFAVRYFQHFVRVDATPLQERIDALKARKASEQQQAPVNDLAGVKIEYTSGSSRERIEDFGARIPEARKHRYETYSVDEIASIDDDTMRSFSRTGSGGASRARVWPAFDLSKALQDGMPARQALMVHEIQRLFASTYASIGARVGGRRWSWAVPDLYESPLGVRIYMAGVANARSLCEKPLDELFSALIPENTALGDKQGWRSDWTKHAHNLFVQPVVDQVLRPALLESGRDVALTEQTSSHMAHMVERLYAKPGKHFWTFKNEAPRVLESLVISSDEDIQKQIAKILEKNRLRSLRAQWTQESRKRQEAPTDAAREGDSGDPQADVQDPAQASAAPAKPRVASHLAMVERSGLPDWREGVHADRTVLMDRFAFRGGQFGNWVPNKERQTWLDMTADALEDFAKELGVPPAFVGLGGMLGIAWGARGHGHAAAHFEPGHNVINLTRKNGAGSLLHEWTHGFDHWLSRTTGLPSSQTLLPFASGDVKERMIRFAPEERYAPYEDVLTDVVKSLREWWEALKNTRYDLNKPEQCALVDARPLTDKKTNPDTFFGDYYTRNEIYGIRNILRGKDKERWAKVFEVDDQLEARVTEVSRDEPLRQHVIDLSMQYLKDNIPATGAHSEFRFNPDIKIKAEFLQKVFDALFDRVIKFKPGVSEIDQYDARRALFDEYKAGSGLLYRTGQLAQYVVRNRAYYAQFGIDFMYEAQHEKRLGGKAYWASPHELLARAMDSYVAHRMHERQASSDFLCKADGWHGLSALDAKLLKEPMDNLLTSISNLANALPESLLRQELHERRQEQSGEEIQSDVEPVALSASDDQLAQSLAAP